jgi:hypothetical protein
MAGEPMIAPVLFGPAFAELPIERGIDPRGQGDGARR